MGGEAGLDFVTAPFNYKMLCRLIDESKHHILKAAHPSGLSAHRGFFGCRYV